MSFLNMLFDAVTPPQDVPDECALPRTAFAEPPQVLDQFTCQICHDVASHPCDVRCGHVFCYGCLSEWCKTKRSCPTCRASIDRVSVSELSTGMAKRLSLHCPNGCATKHTFGNRRELIKHMYDCKETLKATAAKKDVALSALKALLARKDEAISALNADNADMRKLLRQN